MNFLKLVQEARTCRRFDEKQPLAQADLAWLVECARLAPSARNAQELRFVNITGQQNCAKMLEYTKWAGALSDWPGPEPGERPTGFIVILKPAGAGEFTDYSVGIAAFAIQLAAASRHWGACIIGAFNRPKVAEFIEPPQDMGAALVIGLGVEAEKRVLEVLAPGVATPYWRDEQGVHHVPKRPLEELIIKTISQE